MSDPARAPCPHCPNSGKLFSVPHGLRVHTGRKHRDITLSFPVSGTPTTSSKTSNNSSGADITSDFSLADLPYLKTCTRVLRHIPKGARCVAAGKLASVIEQCLESNSTEDWKALLSFAFTALRMPEKDGKKSLTAKVKANIESNHLELLSEGAPRGVSSLYKLVESKVFDGDLSGAARLLTSDCSFAPPNEETLAALREKHPAPSRPVDIPPAPDPVDPCLTVSVADVSEALRSFHRGSASGLDGLRPEHLQELTSPSAGDGGPRLLEMLTKLCNFLLKGQLNPDICPYFYGGSLCALKKKDGGLRPIAVGNTLRRLVAKLCCRAVRSSMASYLQPHQVGFGTPLGCEATIHSTRLFAMRENSDDVLIKLDIRNAFNTVERDTMLLEVKELTPSIYAFLHQCYAGTSNLFYNGKCITSQVGAHQGDPLGPLIFSLAIHKIISSLEAPLNAWYLDDGTIGGSPDTLERDVKVLFPALKKLGLEVNTAKCEFFPCGPKGAETYDKFQSLIPGLKVVGRASLSLLGAPIFYEGINSCMQEKTRTLTSLANHLKHLPAHLSLTLLRNCFAMPKLTYVTRTVPTWKVPEEVTQFDNALKLVLEDMLNIHLSERQWCQASLPVRHGGLGVRRLRETGPSAFLASSHGVADLVTRILSYNGDTLRVPFADEALSTWLALSPDTNAPEHPERQRSWDDPLCRCILSKLRAGSTGIELARINAAAQTESGAWLHALPSPHMGTLLDDDSLRVAAALRLGCPVCEPHVCICGAKVEADGHHGLSCTRCAGRRPRHHAINDLLKRALVLAEVPCILEPPGLSRSDGKRPDGLTLVPWRKGRCLVWDATCVSTFASCHLPATQQSAGAGAEAAARGKRLKYACLVPTYDFVPFAVETAGPWCSAAREFILELGHRLREKSRDPRSGWFLVQRISLAIQRGNAASVLGTFGPGTCAGGR